MASSVRCMMPCRSCKEFCRRKGRSSHESKSYNKRILVFVHHLESMLIMERYCPMQRVQGTMAGQTRTALSRTALAIYCPEATDLHQII